MKYALVLVAAIVAYIEPTIPYLMICTIAIIFDVVSAWDLGRRVKKAYPERKDEAKFTSSAASKVLTSMFRIYAVVFLAHIIDVHLITFVDMYLANIVSAVFCVIQGTSILENISSCNGERWAKILQKVLIDKTSRHLDIELKKEDIIDATEGDKGNN